MGIYGWKIGLAAALLIALGAVASADASRSRADAACPVNVESAASVTPCEAPPVPPAEPTAAGATAARFPQPDPVMLMTVGLIGLVAAGSTVKRPS